MDPVGQVADDPIVFRGSRSLCGEFSLLLEAKNIPHDMTQIEGTWVLSVAPGTLREAYDEIGRYSLERSASRTIPDIIQHSGAGLGAGLYVIVLLSVAYCAGSGMFGADWFAIGALDAAFADG